MMFQPIGLAVVLVVALQVSGDKSSEEKHCDKSICRAEHEILKSINQLRGEVGKLASLVPCPPGFTYKPEAKACYKVLLESLTWPQAQARCLSEFPGSHLVDVTNAAKDKAIVEHLKSLNPEDTEICKLTGPRVAKTPGYYTSGRRPFGDCKKDFVWSPKPTAAIPLTYQNFNPGNPNCTPIPGYTLEACIHYFESFEYRWNDLACERPMCAICEYDK